MSLNSNGTIELRVRLLGGYTIDEIEVLLDENGVDNIEVYNESDDVYLIEAEVIGDHFYSSTVKSIYSELKALKGKVELVSLEAYIIDEDDKHEHIVLGHGGLRVSVGRVVYTNYELI